MRLPLQEFMKTLTGYHEIGTAAQFAEKAAVFLGEERASVMDERPETPEGSFKMGTMLFELGAYRESEPWLRVAAESGLPEAQLRYADFLRDGYRDYVPDTTDPFEPKTFDDDYQVEKMFSNMEVRRNMSEEALDWYCYASAQGNAEAAAKAVSVCGDLELLSERLGSSHQTPKGGKSGRMASDMVDRLRRMADSGDARAVFEYAHMMNDYDILMDAAEDGNIHAIRSLPDLYYKCRIFSEDPLENAVRWSVKGAEMGDADCMVHLCRAHRLGIGVEQSDEIAFDFASRAAALGNRKACLELGKMYFHGNGVERSYPEARGWFMTVPESDEAQYYLGEIYYRGLGVERDYDAAFSWYRLARLQCNGAAEVKLGVMLASGRGTDRDHRRFSELFLSGFLEGHSLSDCLGEELRGCFR